MPKANELGEITQALSAPLGELIAAVGRGVAEAQWALDQHTLESFKAIYGSDDVLYRELRDLGYQPTWYRIPEATAEIYVTLSASGKETMTSSVPNIAPSGAVPAVNEPSGRIELYATPVDASFSNTYDYRLQACSQLKFRVVPVPASDGADGMKVVPQLLGQTYADATALLDRLGIIHGLEHEFIEPRGDETIASTQPGAGSVLPAGRKLVLTLSGKASMPPAAST
ncbi:PASTA domain-containing protein [Methyloterricola oryzae]|uniref:PASTA domain-containing protein n=1 Tax=Methyloterricola oryzae TaxID=1495050 RepID=UPI0005EB2F09|nr:PASTA domain-containing protein [Methyloterricola oryzae]